MFIIIFDIVFDVIFLDFGKKNKQDLLDSNYLKIYCSNQFVSFLFFQIFEIMNDTFCDIQAIGFFLSLNVYHHKQTNERKHKKMRNDNKKWIMDWSTCVSMLVVIDSFIILF